MGILKSHQTVHGNAEHVHPFSSLSLYLSLLSPHLCTTVSPHSSTPSPHHSPTFLHSLPLPTLSLTPPPLPLLSLTISLCLVEHCSCQ